MLKKLGLMLIAGSLVLGTLPASGEAANLSRLLGAQRPAITRSAPAERSELGAVRSAPAQKPQASVPKRTTSTLGALGNATPRLPLLRKLIKLYLVLLAHGHFD
ncbi:MAG: hypothetical protein SH850_02545 [Planctomycetaceae bacterium]|nr:hypothetical protein [Planctomycetaceae bacterium]